MEQVISQPASFNPLATFKSATVDDNWVIQQLLGIRDLEQKIEWGLANKENKQAVQRQVSELRTRLGQLDDALDCSAGRKQVARSLRLRAS